MRRLAVVARVPELSLLPMSKRNVLDCLLRVLRSGLDGCDVGWMDVLIDMRASQFHLGGQAAAEESW